MRKLLPITFVAAALVSLVSCGGARSSSPPAGPGAAGGGAGSTLPATNADYERALDQWVDHPEEDLVAAWGVPERSQRLTDGGQALQYRRTGSEGRLLCTTLFTSDVYGMIRTWSYRGSDCRAPHLGDYSNPS